MRQFRVGGVIAALLFALLPSALRAQSATSGAIAGTIRDTTGAVLPGVTVEAASPALIERVRTATTDAQGNYKIVDLRPGTYTVTFALAGFGTYKRDGLALTTGVTANVNAELKVGGLEETVTVTGGSPVVDIQNVRNQNVLSRDALDALPTAKSLQSYAALTLGATFSSAADQDVGGSKGEAGGFGYFVVHGGDTTSQRDLMDGMSFYALIGEGAAGNRTNYVNQLMVQETSIVTGGAGADSETGGVLINIVPKDGGNSFSGTLALSGTGSRLQSSNLTESLIARGIPTPPKVKRIYDGGGAIGGPVKKDSLWFYTAHRWWGTQNIAPGNYFDATPHSLTYTADLSQPAYTNFPHRTNDVRLTWQVSTKNKVTFWESIQDNCNCNYEIDRGTRAPEATADLRYYPSYLTQGTWSFPATNKWLLDAGNTTLWEEQDNLRNNGVLPTDISITELSTGYMYNARATSVGAVDYGIGSKVHQSNQRFSMSYVTGSHAFKAGVYSQEGWGRQSPSLNNIPGLGPVSFQFRNGVPVQLTEFSSPNHFRYRLMPNMGIYAQDQWTRRKLTLNGGVRFDRVREYSPAETVDAIPELGIPARTFAEVDDVPNWKDLTVRGGAAYDVFGNGKTAIKGSIGKYPLSQVAGIGFANAGANRIATVATRTWTDGNGNFAPDCSLANPLTNGECGTLSNVNLGQPIAATVYDPAFIHGWGKRPYNSQTSILLQQELRPGMALNVGYFRTWYGNFSVTANTATAPADFTPYCITAPTDSRLGAASGQQVCGFYDVNPNKFGQVANVAQLASNFGKQYQHYNGIDAGVSARFGKGGLLQGGVNVGQTVTDNCAFNESPQIPLTIAVAGVPNSGNATESRTTPFCHVVLPWSAQTQIKGAVSYPLPWYGLQLSGNLQSLSGIPIQAFYVATNAQIAPSLGRNLAAGAAGTATLALMQPNTQFEGRINQIDLRVTKIVKMGRLRFQGMFDVYNAMNASPITQEVYTYGPNWLKPSAVLGGRLMKFGGQFDF